MQYHVVHKGFVYRLTRDAWKRVLLLWARSGEKPEFIGFQGITRVSPAPFFLDDWDLEDVEQGLLDFLRDERKGE